MFSSSKFDATCTFCAGINNEADMILACLLDLLENWWSIHSMVDSLLCSILIKRFPIAFHHEAFWILIEHPVYIEFWLAAPELIMESLKGSQKVSDIQVV